MSPRSLAVCLAALVASGSPLARAQQAMLIHDVQGTGAQSSHVGEMVTVQGIVTAVLDDGFYVQSTPGLIDFNEATSEGIFVAIGAMPVSVAPGNLVRVTGYVDEARDPGVFHGPTRTQLLLQALVVSATGQALPEPYPVVTQALLPENDANYLERFEGMRVTMPGLRTIEPTDGTFHPATGKYTRAGILFANGYAPNVRREAGLPAGVEDPSGRATHNDGNPERIRIDSLARPGSSPLLLDVPDTIFGMRGILDDRSGMRTLFPDPDGAPLFGYWSQMFFIPPIDQSVAGLGTMVLEPFFDDVDDPGRSEPIMLPDDYRARIDKLGGMIYSEGMALDIIAVTGVENRRVLDDLAIRLNALADGSYPHPARHYFGVFPETTGQDGTGVGYLVNGFATADGAPRISITETVEVGTNARIDQPDGGNSLLFDRPALLVGAVIHPLDSLTLGEPVTLLTVSLHPDRESTSLAAGARGWATRGAEVRARRLAQAHWLSDYIEARQIAHPDEKLLVTGDFQASAVVDGMVDVIGLLRGSASNDVMSPGSSSVTRPLVLLDATLEVPEAYDRIIDGEQVLHSHFLASAPFIAAAFAPRIDLVRRNAQWSVDSAADPLLPLRTGNVDPMRLAFGSATLERSDWFVTTYFEDFNYATTTPTDMNFDFDVGTLGPLVGRNPTVEVRLSRPVAFIASMAREGWACTATQVLADQAIAHCAPDAPLPDLASSTGNQVHVHFTTGANDPDGYEIRVSVSTDSVDPDPINNRRVIALHGVTGGDLVVQVSTPSQPLVIGEPVYFDVLLANNGPGTATSAAIDLSINTDRGIVVDELTAIACDAPVTASGRTSLHCAVPSLAAFQGGRFRLRVNTDDSLDAAGLRISATGSSTSDDPRPENNSVEVVVPRVPRLLLTWTGDVPNPVPPGTTLHLAWTVVNQGSSAATDTSVIFAAPPGLDMTVTPPSPWQCAMSSPPLQTLATCTGPALPAGASLVFAMDIGTTRAINGESPLFGITYTGPAQTAGNYAPVYLNFNSRHDALVVIAPPKGVLRKGQTGRMSVVIGNDGPESAPPGLLVFESNLPPRTLHVLGHPNWQCAVAGNTATRTRMECRNTAALSPGAREALAFDVTPSIFEGNLLVQANASLFTDSGELDESNNSASREFRFAGPTAAPVEPRLATVPTKPALVTSAPPAPKPAPAAGTSTAAKPAASAVRSPNGPASRPRPLRRVVRSVPGVHAQSTKPSTADRRTCLRNAVNHCAPARDDHRAD